MNLRQCLMLGLMVAGWLCDRPLPAGASDNPYTPIITRNIFGLVPIVTNPPDANTPDVPPPKITPNGIMTLFGKLQVLFKVTDNTPGQPPKEDAYVMSVGDDRQDDIEVLKIDAQADVITFNNHGVVQELLLASAEPDKPGPVPGRPAFGRPFGFGGRTPVGFGGRFGRAQINPPANNPSPVPIPASAITASSFGSSTPTSVSAPSAPAQPAMTPEQQILMIEAQRLNYLQQGDPTAKLLPITPLTSQTTGQGGDGGDGGDAAPAPAPGD